MQAPCEVKLQSGGGWKPALLTTDHAASSYGLPVVAIGGHAVNALDVATIRVTASCPVDLFDAAVSGGYHVLGQPGQNGGAER